MPHLHLASAFLEPTLDVQQTGNVATYHKVGPGGIDLIQLEVEDGRRHLGKLDRKEPPEAAALGSAFHLGDIEPLDLGQQGCGLSRQPEIAVTVARVVISRSGRTTGPEFGVAEMVHQE